jgi:hypothetical protein
MLREEPHSQKESEKAVGLGTDNGWSKKAENEADSQDMGMEVEV